MYEGATEKNVDGESRQKNYPVCRVKALPNPVSGVSSKFRLDPNLRKLPPPVVYWSSWEKDAHRKNRSIQVKLSKDLGHIARQCDLSERKIRHDAMQFRERINSFWPDPMEVIFGSGYPIRTSSVKGKRHRGSRRSERGRISTYLKFTGHIVKSAHSVSKPYNPDSDSSSDSELHMSSEDESQDKSSAHVTKPEVTQSSVKPKSAGHKLQFASKVAKFPNRRKSETDLSTFKSEYLTSEEVTKTPSPKQQRCFSAKPITALSQANPEERDFSAKTTSIERNKRDAKTGLSSINADNEPELSVKNLCFTETLSSSALSRPRTGNFLFDRTKATYELKMELRKSARDKRRQPIAKKYDRGEHLAEEKSKYLVSQDNVRGYLERLDSYLRPRDS